MSKHLLTSENKTVQGQSKLLYYGLLVIFIMEYTRFPIYFSFLNNFMTYTLIPLTIFILSFSSRNKPPNSEILKTTNSKFILFFIIITVLSIFTSDNFTASYQIFILCIGYGFLVFIIMKNITSIGQLKGVFLTLISCHLFLIFMNIDIISDPYTRSYIKNVTFLGDGNDFALSLCIVIPFCIYLANNEKRKSLKSLYFLIMFLLVLTIIGTSSRGGSLALFFVFLYIGSKSNNKWKLSFYMVFLIIGIFAYAPPAYFKRLENVNNYQESSAQGRISAWKAAIKMAKDHPILGVGSGQFPVKYSVEYSDDLNRGALKTAHSMYFLALGELGFPGLFFLIGFILSNLIKNEKIIRQITKEHTNNNYQADANLMIYLNASLVGFSVAGAFLSVLYYPHIFILAGLLGVGRTIVKNHLGETSPTKIFSSR